MGPFSSLSLQSCKRPCLWNIHPANLGVRFPLAALWVSDDVWKHLAKIVLPHQKSSFFMWACWCCLRMLLGIKWHQFLQNNKVWRLVGQPKLTAIVQSCRLTLFGHIARMDDNADAKNIVSTLPPKDWRRPRGRPTSHGWAPYSRIWDPTISHCLKQWIWPRTGLCGGCVRRMALCHL